MDKKEKPQKEKRRNNEKRKEKSRDAARSRRTRETEIFTDLANALPLTQEQVLQLDKASIMRLAISYLRVRDMVGLVPEIQYENEKSDKLELTEESVFLKSLEGFLVVLSADGDFVYLSENVSDYLGISQIDLMGQNVYEYSHPCDHDEIRETLSCKSDDFESPKSIFIRLKCTLTSKGRSVNLKSATYKVIHCTGHILKTNVKMENGQRNMTSCFVAVGQPIPHPSNIESPLPRQTFLTKHSLDMKFTHADDKIMTDVLGYSPEDLNGKSVYEYHHAMDSDSICSAYKCLFAKGQCETNRYRFLAKTGGFVWVVTQATLIYDKMQKPQSVVCVNYIISGVECKDEIYSASQFASLKSESVNKIDTTVSEIVIPLTESVTLETTETNKPVVITAKLFATYPAEEQIVVRPQTATSKIFVNRTEEMNKGFLTFSDDEPGLTMLKDEPDDLTHLAPEAGDVCVPLVDHPFLSDILDDFLLRDNLGPLLNDEPLDPFLAYRDFNNSPQMLSPNVSKSECSLPSLNSPSDSLGEEDHMSTFINLQMDDEQSDLAGRAPYISMNEDLPLLADDLMWSSSDKMKNIPNSNSSLAQLLSSSVNKHSLKSSDSGGHVSDEIYNDTNKNANRCKIERTPSTKRTNTTAYDTSNKRTRNAEPKEKMSSELLQQLMSNNHHRGRPKGKSNWLLDSGGQKAACISQPSDSVLMNLLDDPMEGRQISGRLSKKRIKMDKEVLERRNTIRKNSISLLDPESTIPSFMDLTQQDFEVNAPVSNLLLGEDLLTALDVTGPI